MPSTAIIYARYSPRRHETLSNERQLQVCREFCRARGWGVADVYTDEDVSGKRALSKRPGAAAMLEALRKRPPAAGALVVHDSSRLSRELDHLVALAKLLHQQRVALHFASEGGDAVNVAQSDGFLVFAMRGVISQYQRMQTSERTRDDLRRRQARGGAVSKVPPYGYKIEGGQLVEDEREQAVIHRMIMTWHDDGYNAYQIAKELDYHKVPPRGKRWWVTAVQRIIRRESDRAKWAETA